jgi:ATP-binding cassette, subfamily B, bacterial
VLPLHLIVERVPQDQSWAIGLANVRFGYPTNRGLLSIPYLHIEAGEFVAVVGENGAGKSTLARLLARLYDVDSGSIYIAGHDVRGIEIESLRERVCYAPPHPILFDTTLASNLRLGKIVASDSELEEVIACVGLKDWVGTLQGNLNQRIGPGGSQLSGGQRQRLGIGRAMLLPGSTIIVILHRPSAMLCVQRVVLLEAGRIVEDDNPAALRTNGAYSRLFSAISPTELHDASIHS